MQVFLRGGLGNQLFQYAAGVYLAQKQNDLLILRTDLLPLTQDMIGGASRWPLQLNEFSIEGSIHFRKHQPVGKTNWMSKARQSQRMVGDLFPGLLKKLGIIAGEKSSPDDFANLSGIRVTNSYCTSSQPAISLGDYLRGQIKSLIEPSQDFVDLLAEAKTKQPVMVHLRLGDYRNLTHIYGKPNYGKITNLLRDVREKNPSEVWIFTDSPEDVGPGLRKEFGAKRLIGPNELRKPIENMILMSSGSNLICANSTFSWWAAFLMNQKGQVYYPDPGPIAVNNFPAHMVSSDWKKYESY